MTANKSPAALKKRLLKKLSAPGIIGALSRQHSQLASLASMISNGHAVSEYQMLRVDAALPAAIADLEGKAERTKAHDLAKKQARDAIKALPRGSITPLAKRAGLYPQFVINFKNGADISAEKLAALWEVLK